MSNTCQNCTQRIGEECGITGREVYPDDSCNQFQSKNSEQYVAEMTEITH
jgi:hypothetical protein